MIVYNLPKPVVQKLLYLMTMDLGTQPIYSINQDLKQPHVYSMKVLFTTTLEKTGLGQN